MVACRAALLTVSLLVASAASAAEPEPAATPSPVPVATASPAPAKDPHKPKISGYIQAQYLTEFDTNHDGHNDPDRMRVQRARVELKGKATDRVSYDLEVDPRAPLITGILRDAFLGVKVLPHQTLRIGQQKTQFGFENVESSTRLYVVNRSEVSDNLARGYTERDDGVGLIGKVPLGKSLALENAITVVNGAGMNVQADDDHYKNVFGRLGLRADAGGAVARLGASGAYGTIFDEGDNLVADGYTVDDFNTQFRTGGADLEIDHPLGFVAAEFVGSRQEVLRSGPAVTDPDETAGTVIWTRGWYALAAVKTPWRVGPLLRYDTFEDYWRWTPGIYYGLPEDPVRVLLNYEIRGPSLSSRLYLWAQVRF